MTFNTFTQIERLESEASKAFFQMARLEEQAIETLLHNLRVRLLNNEVLRLKDGKRIHAARYATDKSFLVLYLADEEGKQLWKEDGYPVLQGIWADDHNFSYLEALVI